MPLRTQHNTATATIPQFNFLITVGSPAMAILRQQTGLGVSKHRKCHAVVGTV